jgi:hypothetical protein
VAKNFSYEKQIGANDEVKALFEKAEEKDFEIFAFKKATGDKELIALSSLIFLKH